MNKAKIIGLYVLVGFGSGVLGALLHGTKTSDGEAFVIAAALGMVVMGLYRRYNGVLRMWLNKLPLAQRPATAPGTAPATVLTEEQMILQQLNLLFRARNIVPDDGEDRLQLLKKILKDHASVRGTCMETAKSLDTFQQDNSRLRRENAQQTVELEALKGEVHAAKQRTARVKLDGVGKAELAKFVNELLAEIAKHPAVFMKLKRNYADELKKINDDLEPDEKAAA